MSGNMLSMNKVHVYLTLLIDPNDSRRAVVSGRDKYGFRTDAIHVYTRAWLQIIHVEITILSNEVDNTVLGTDLLEREIHTTGVRMCDFEVFSYCNKVRYSCHLHGHRKISLCFRREEHIHRFLSEGLVTCLRLTNLDDVHLRQNTNRIITDLNIYITD